MLVTFVGCAGVGKNTIIDELIKRYPQKYRILPTLTTREMRKGETQGNPYYFVSKAEFLKLLDDGELYEHEFIHNSDYYGGSKRILRECVQEGKVLLKDIDVLGSATLKKKLSDQMRVMAIFLYVEDKNTLLERMRGRGNSEEEILNRSKRFDFEMERSYENEYMLNNVYIKDTADIAAYILEIEAQNGIYRPSKSASEVDKSKLEQARNDIKNGKRLESVILTYNGLELLVTDGYERYLAAGEANAFIQKKIVSPTDTSII